MQSSGGRTTGRTLRRSAVLPARSTIGRQRRCSLLGSPVNVSLCFYVALWDLSSSLHGEIHHSILFPRCCYARLETVWGDGKKSWIRPSHKFVLCRASSNHLTPLNLFYICSSKPEQDNSHDSTLLQEFSIMKASCQGFICTSLH